MKEVFTMKQWAISCALIFLVMSVFSASAVATEQINLGIDISKNVSSTGELYGIRFVLNGSGLKNVKGAMINIPNGLKTSLVNNLGFTSIDLGAGSMNYTTFGQRFPEGLYSVKLAPNQYGVLQATVVYDFPTTPEITSPQDGAVDVLLTPTVTWYPLGNGNNLRLRILTQGNSVVFNTILPPDATSLEVPANLLDPGTQYMYFSWL